MNIPKRVITLSALMVAVLSLVTTSPVSAHVVVRPAEVLTASFQTFNVSVPNEKVQSTTAVKVSIPKGLKHVTPTVKQGWQIDVEKEGEGEAAIVTSITWKGNSIPAGFRDDFSFSAQVPAAPGELQWKAYQTYADGQVVSWDLTKDQQPKKADGSPDFSKSGPLSVTALTDKAAVSTNENVQNTGNNRAIYVGVAGILLGLAGIFLGTRKKS